jgi:cell wall-associated NlpC family hydrolase
MALTKTNLARAPLARLLGAALLAALLVGGTVTVSAARPSHQDLDAAKAELDAMNRHLDLLVEQYDQARVQLEAAQGQLVDARNAAARAQAEASAARAQLSARAAAAYEGAGSEIEAILGSATFSEFADRLEFVNSIARQDADAATQAEIKRQESIRASSRLHDAIARQQSILEQIRTKTAEIKSGIAAQEALVAQLEKELAKPLYPKPKPPAQQQSGGGQPPPKGPGDPGPTPSPSPSPPPPPPPPPGGGAGVAVQAAFSVIGVPYKWGGSNPQEGFDCSGLTMWSWAQAGVSLPHSSAGQYAMLPHVSKDQLQPGDLVFFYVPISHVGIYVGGGMMIHSPHTGGYVEEVPLSSEPDYVGAGRPG